MLPIETYFSFKDTGKLKLKGWKKIFGQLYKIEFKPKTLTRDKEHHYIMIKG